MTNAISPGHAEIVWRHPPPLIQLSPMEAHLWCASLDGSEEEVSGYFKHLSDQEKARAENFKFETDRRRFISGRGILRLILSNYLGALPAELMFRYSNTGKPSLGGGFEDLGIQFSLSHSHGIGLYALTMQHAIGVDLEKIRSGTDPQAIARRFFTPREFLDLQSLPISVQETAFHHAWTRKEAYLKATGEGITESLSKIEVSLTPDEPPRLHQVEGKPGEAAAWMLQALQPAHGYIGAVAVRQRGARLACWQWHGQRKPKASILHSIGWAGTFTPTHKHAGDNLELSLKSA
jgi:4'-phosphopantetheinyl transferase